ncbi:retrovirus-related pol polyprotein LINE-1 [Tanacetum coccineum]
MPGRSSVKAIPLIRSLMKKYRERQRDLHLAFLDLEKAYDSVPRELIWKTLIEKETPRRYIKVIRDMYDGAKTREDIPWCLIFANDIVLDSESTEECWPIMKSLANKMEVTKLRMLRWICGKKMHDMIPNGVYRTELKVDTIINKMREWRLRFTKNLLDRVSQLYYLFLLPKRLKADNTVRVNWISQVTYRRACLMLALEGFPSSL